MLESKRRFRTLVVLLTKELTRKSLAMEEMVAKEGRDRSKLDLDHYSQEWPNDCLSSMIGRLDKVSKSIYIHIHVYVCIEREREREN